MAARMSGASRTRMILRHILPNVLPYFLVSGSLQVASAVLSESFTELSRAGRSDPAELGPDPAAGAALSAASLVAHDVPGHCVVDGNPRPEPDG